MKLSEAFAIAALLGARAASAMPVAQAKVNEDYEKEKLKTAQADDTEQFEKDMLNMTSFNFHREGGDQCIEWKAVPAVDDWVGAI